MVTYTHEAERGIWHEPIRLVGNPMFFNEIAKLFTDEIMRRRIPANFFMAEYGNGRMFSRTSVPLLLINNTEPGCKFFTLGFYLNQGAVFFPLFGESVENTRANKYDYFRNQGIGLRAMLYKPDMLKLEREHLWQAAIGDCFDFLLSN